MNRIYKIAKKYGKGTRARTCAAAFLAALALTGVMGMSEVQASTVTGDDGQIGGVVINHGIYYKNTALRDGSLYLGDTSGNYSQITPKSAKLGQVTIDDKGYITGANYMQTNALNSKYNFSVGTAAENGTMPFFVNSTGDFYAANNKFSVNKDGKVTDKGAQLAGINVSGNIISNGAAKIALYGDSGVAGMVNGKGASIYMQDGNTVINSKVAIDKDGKVTGVAAGAVTAGSKDAVNGGQLYATNQLVKDNASNISLLGNSIDKLDNRVNKVGAGAAALAALHPLDFDPEDKWDFAAGYGNYSGASAVALGAYYRPNEDTMFSVGGSFGNGENMVNAGVSLKLGQSSHAPASKAAMEKKISALSQEVEELKAAIADLRAAQTKAKDAQKK